jgi:CRP-like cAMP-binding protein
MVAELCELLWKTKGDLVIREGEVPRGFYILLQGEVSVSKKLSLPQLDHADPEDRILTRISSEGRPALGETALVGQPVRSASVRCLGDCALYRIDSDKLLSLIEREPEIGFRVYRRLSETLYHRMETTSVDVVKLSAALVYALEE